MGRIRLKLTTDLRRLFRKAVVMTPMVHLLWLPILLSIAAGADLEIKKGPFENKELNVQEGTPAPYAVYQFQAPAAGVNSFRLSGEGTDSIKISPDGWLYLEKPLDWSQEDHYILSVEALVDEEVVGGPIEVTINVLDVNNNPPRFNQSSYTATVREGSKAGVPFIRVFASDQDDPETPNAQLRYSLDSQIPNNHNVLLFQVNPDTGEISTTAEGEEMLRSREAIQFAQGEERSSEMLKKKFDEVCSVQEIPYEQNPFYTCVERQEMRRTNLDPLEYPDYTLIVRVEDMGGAEQNALSGNTRVNIAVQQNLWVNPGPIKIEENLDTQYPHSIAKVQSNDPNAIYMLVQKERVLRFPFQITESGEILLTEKLDREEKDMYILVVFAKDSFGNEVDTPMEIHIQVEDVNDNEPLCEHDETVFEVQEDEPAGSFVGQLLARDDDQEGTIYSHLKYTIESISPSSSDTFSIDETNARLSVLRVLQRKEQSIYNLNIKVSDSDYSTLCKVVIKVIDVNNEIPRFEKNDYGNQTLAEDSPVGHTVLTFKATDADEPNSGSSLINFHITAGNDGENFAVETDGLGVGHLVIVKPLDFESSPVHNLQIDARNPEQLKKDLEYGSESTAVFVVAVTDVDEVPEFELDVLDVAVPENLTKGAVLLAVEAKDPEQKQIKFKLDGDAHGVLDINEDTGEIRLKEKLDREKLETFEVTVTAFEKANAQKFAQRVLHVRVLDVNDNVPKLKDAQAFICIKDVKPVFISAHDPDSEPFAQPFTFKFAKTYTNWNLQQIDETSAKVELKKKPIKEGNFSLGIVIKDNGGIGVTQMLEVKICNCTMFGYCKIPLDSRDFGVSLGSTIGILGGVIGFCIILFIAAIKCSDKKNRDEGAQKGMI